MSEYWPLIAKILFASAFGFIVLSGTLSSRRLAKAREKALRDFRAVVVESIDPKLRFRGVDATILKIEEPANPHKQPAAWYSISIFACNEFGEYFMFKSLDSYVKHIPHHVAKHVLQEAYKPPPIVSSPY